MPIYFTPEQKLLAWYDQKTIKKYRPIISAELINQFGRGPYNEKEMTKILFSTLEWYQNKFWEVISNETELSFYQALFLFHEVSCDFQQKKPNVSPVKEMNNQEFAVYRRVLKLCLEQGCDLKLTSGPPGSIEYLKSKEDVIDSLLYLGDFIFACSNLLAEQHLIEDCVDLKFTGDDLYYFDHKHHYGHIIKELLNSLNGHLDHAVTGNNDFIDFKAALKDCLGVDYDMAVATIQAIHENADGGKFILDEWWIFPQNLENLYGIPYKNGEQFFRGLTLTKENKMSLGEAVYKPHNINKYLYRPFLVYNVEGADLTFVGDKSFVESIMSLTTNAIGWGKFPEEWNNECFAAYVKRKVSANDKILEDEAEKILDSAGIIFDRNIKYLRRWNGQHLNIDNPECGEIDFLFLHNSIIYIADSKHQLARYDMNNFRNDYAYFETNKKAYNKTIKRKIEFLSNMASQLEEHFQVLQNDRNFKLGSFEVEGIFIVNTPTFIMYNNAYRIYTLKDFSEFINNTFADKTYMIFIEDEEYDALLEVNYPYFKKPNYKVFDDLDLDEESK